LDNLLRFVQEGEDAQDPPPWPVIVARGEVADNGDIELLQWSSPFHPRYFSMGLEGVEREKVVAFIREHLAEPGVRLSDILVSLPERYRPLDLAVGIVSPAGGGAYLRLDGTQHRLAGYLAVLPKVGPEVLTGSTRLKAGTATKLVLNTLTTASMARLGRVWGNRMVDVVPRSAKLRARAQALVAELGGVPRARARRLLAASGGRVRLAVVMARTGLGRAAAARALARAGGSLRAVLAPARHAP